MAMDRMMRVGVIAVLLNAAVGSSGCEHMNNTEKGAGIGGALGAGAGLAVGAATGNPRTGAAVGGLLGAGTGALVGNDVDRQEKRDRDIQQAVATADAQAQQQRMGMTDVVHLAQPGSRRPGHHQSDPQLGQHIPARPLRPRLPEEQRRVVAGHCRNAGGTASPLATRVVGPREHTVIYEPVYGPPPVFVGPGVLPASAVNLLRRPLSSALPW